MNKAPNTIDILQKAYKLLVKKAILKAQEDNSLTAERPIK